MLVASRGTGMLAPRISEELPVLGNGDVPKPLSHLCESGNLYLSVVLVEILSGDYVVQHLVVP